jgi:hypothetical protein
MGEYLSPQLSALESLIRVLRAELRLAIASAMGGWD